MTPTEVLKMLKSKIDSAALNKCNYAIETSDIEAINQALLLHDVVGRSEQLKAFMHFAEFAKQEYGLHIPLNLMKEYVKSL